VVLQDVFLFADTIYNITLNNPEITREDVLAAAKEIGVMIIMSLPDNYDFDVKERGVMLSGQRQLIAFYVPMLVIQVF
jgi:ABC-type bacteriocin/lantibiotic exporter with double-glycine peptidase domain